MAWHSRRRPEGSQEAAGALRPAALGFIRPSSYEHQYPMLWTALLVRRQLLGLGLWFV